MHFPGLLSKRCHSPSLVVLRKWSTSVQRFSNPWQRNSGLCPGNGFSSHTRGWGHEPPGQSSWHTECHPQYYHLAVLSNWCGRHSWSQGSCHHCTSTCCWSGRCHSPCLDHCYCMLSCYSHSHISPGTSSQQQLCPQSPESHSDVGSSPAHIWELFFPGCLAEPG